MSRKNEPGRALRVLLSERVRIERARLKLSQEDLGHLAGLSRVHVGAIERHEVACTLDVLAKLALALELPPHELLKPAVTRRKLKPPTHRDKLHEP